MMAGRTEMIWPTLAFTPDPERGYDPLAAIASGEKRHTLRKQGVRGVREITAGRKRTGRLIRITGHRRMTSEEFLTDEFAQSDGLPDAAALRETLVKFYGAVPESMWLNTFELVEE